MELDAARVSLVGAARGLGAWLFDLDGVLTDTASLHDRAWTTTFDAFLASLDPPGTPFDPDDDYERFVDGKPAADGVRDFLASRGIVVGHHRDPETGEMATVEAIARRKDQGYLELLDTAGVQTFPDAVALLDAVKSAGCRCAVVTASRHCAEVLAAAGLKGRFDVEVDGNLAKVRQLRGKPAPDTYLLAASLLGTSPGAAAIVEDAPAGVAAGRAGEFGFVVGVARRASKTALLGAGAGAVVHDLRELLESRDAPASQGPS